jgi:hypothetical protein
MVTVRGTHDIKGVSANKIASVVGNPRQAREDPSRTALIGERDGAAPKGVLIITARIGGEVGKLKAVVDRINNPGIRGRTVPV